VSLIYNKTINDTIDIGKMEEKLLVIKLPSKRVIPAVDINCNTFEIPYEQKTMEALIRNLAANTTSIENTSKRYRININNIYKHINNIPITDKDEMEISQYIKEKLRKATDKNQLLDRLSSIKAGMSRLQKSRLTCKILVLLNTGRQKLRSFRPFKIDAGLLKLRLIHGYKAFADCILKSKYLNMAIKKQH
ncbi:MAG TPA: hypothetical protein VN549_06715, partial [Negativicutes bacterium]|nr:hypothetical protein [Negativicutes bacterium]